MTELQRQLEREVEAFREVQRDMQKTMQAKAQLLSQSNENEMVIEELGRLDEDSNVFKLIGPALIKQARPIRRDPSQCSAPLPDNAAPGRAAACHAAVQATALNVNADLTEARANVNKRLEYIRGEMARVDAQIKSLQDKGSARQQEIMKLQKRVAGAAGGS
ncbi:prefoldin beta subunit [Monoraphidium neglectum]|uniref:Prefoldin beta subunit n=1 Tax=Monoraphidium neglectum TaxID=145388 RepID=A0A0D2JCG3_9CHLO|nr:prefoldin beta subunit [Monoraphidium neglectum]KIY97372.1 prefoldin beta subunit [Monoraphidium neglectum]|eukprot:XP_013896392.1 prefoldin beta subunit [Monoraphidium neglectum]